MPRYYRIDDVEYQTEDLTLVECSALQKELGLKWTEISPITDADHARAVIAAFLRRTISADEAQRRVDALTAGEFFDLVRFEPDAENEAPKDEPAEPDPSESKTSSTGASSDSDGGRPKSSPKRSATSSA